MKRIFPGRSAASVRCGMSGMLAMSVVLAFSFVLMLLFEPLTPACAAAVPMTSQGSQDKWSLQNVNGQSDVNKAFSDVLAGAERGDAQALLKLGAFYAEGVVVQRNYSKARECYEKAAQAGAAEGIYNVGVCWEIGMGSEADPARAAEYFKKAADMMLPQALFKMSLIFDSGSGVSRDEKTSVDYMIKAATAGHPDAASIMGVVYVNGLRGQKKNAEEGMKMLKRAAASGRVEAIKNIAVVYKDGIGIKASPADALKWYVIAEKCGYPSEALSAVTGDLRKKLSKEQQEKAELDADAWIKVTLSSSPARN